MPPSTPTGFMIVRTSHGQMASVVTLEWNLVDAVMYTVSIAPSPPNGMNSITNALTPLNVTLSNQQTYQISIIASNGDGNSGPATLDDVRIGKCDFELNIGCFCRIL